VTNPLRMRAHYGQPPSRHLKIVKIYNRCHINRIGASYPSTISNTEPLCATVTPPPAPECSDHLPLLVSDAESKGRPITGKNSHPQDKRLCRGACRPSRLNVSLRKVSRQWAGGEFSSHEDGGLREDPPALPLVPGLSGLPVSSLVTIADGQETLLCAWVTRFHPSEPLSNISAHIIVCEIP
jgi:hypothetical protein